MGKTVFLVLVRHGESEWNKENKFTGWTDVALSCNGEIEAKEAGKLIKESKIKFDVVYTSVLKRAIFTTWEILKVSEQQYVPVKNSWRLNERHYGALQGLNKADTAAKYGESQVKVWRRSYDSPPPPLQQSDLHSFNITQPFAAVPTACVPSTECLKDTVSRVLPYYFDEIEPNLKNGKNVLVSAHGNSLRALVKYLDNMSETAVVELEIPTAAPLVYEMDSQLAVTKKYYLLDDATLKARIDKNINQGKAK